MQSTRKKKINYAEVDSDVDLDEEERELDKMKASEQLNSKENKSKKVGDTFGTTSRGSSKKKRRTTTPKSDRRSNAAEEPDNPTYDSKLLLDIPFDLFVEVCSHLDGKDLLSLAQVDTVLRNILLSRGARSIWSSLRRKLGFPLPDGLSELDFALLEYLEKCQVCEKNIENRKMNTFLRTRFCQKCSKPYTISSKGLFKAWPSLHRSTIHCVRYYDDKYLISDLETVDAVLKELEDDDENARCLLESTRTKGSSTRPRQSNISAPSVEANHVENFTSNLIKVNRERLEEEAEEAEAERAEAELQAIKTIVKSLKSDHQWAADEADYLQRWGVFERVAPKVTVREDPAAWTECRALIRKEIDENIAERIRQQALRTRRSAIRPYYLELELEKDQWNVFPGLDGFMEFSSIKPLWEPEGAVIDEDTWSELRPQILEELTALQESNRVEAIRCILAANRGLSSKSSLSKDPADYPPTYYNENFFARVTSLFVRYGWNNRTKPLAPYPEILHGRPSDLSSQINRRSMLIIRSLVEAAGKDPDRFNASDLGRLEKGFIWINDPRKTKRSERRWWFQLFDDAYYKGPSYRKIIEGEGLKFKYRSSSTSESDDDDSNNDDGENVSQESDGDEEDMEENEDGGSQAGSNAEEEDSEQDNESDED
ncbi:F-box protein [Sporobolomyces salmoneus]|uniref:F-box protein n=1 Tax=Sporobolomyces salmoneus TaxID=183962 RepID=UPI003178ACAD